MENPATSNSDEVLKFFSGSLTREQVEEIFEDAGRSARAQPRPKDEGTRIMRYLKIVYR